MAKSSMKIVLVDPLGDILFSGDSLIGHAMHESDDVRATTTSGIYPRRGTGAETDGDPRSEDEEGGQGEEILPELPANARTRAA